MHRSIENSEKALSVMPKDHPNRAVELCRLGHALAQSFKNTGTKAELDRSIVSLEEGLKFTPQGHPSRTARLLRLGLALQARFKLTKSPSDRDQSIAVFKDGLAVVTAPPSDRITAAWFASRLLAEDDAKLAKPFLRVAIELMPIITPRTLKQSDKQYGIARFAGIPSQVASLYLECEEKPYDALQLLELGRGVLASLQLEIRSDVSSLRLSHPVPAKQFDDIRLQLDTQMNSAQQSNIDHRHAVSRQLESLLAQIRGLDGFERFLLGPSDREMMELAQDGAIVIFNVSHIRSDAFLVQKHSIGSLRLPLLKHSTLEAHSKLFLETMHSVRLPKL